MPAWAAILAAFIPTMVLLFGALIHFEGRIARLEGKTDAILAILAGNPPKTAAQPDPVGREAVFRVPGR